MWYCIRVTSDFAGSPETDTFPRQLDQAARFNPFDDDAESVVDQLVKFHQGHFSLGASDVHLHHLAAQRTAEERQDYAVPFYIGCHWELLCRL